MAGGNNCYHAPLDHQSSLKWSDGALYAQWDTPSLIISHVYDSQIAKSLFEVYYGSSFRPIWRPVETIADLSYPNET